jgi:hypothetical protein
MSISTMSIFHPRPVIRSQWAFRCEFLGAPTNIVNATCVDPIIDAADDHARINDWINDWIMIGFAPHKNQ